MILPSTDVRPLWSLQLAWLSLLVCFLVNWSCVLPRFVLFRLPLSSLIVRLSVTFGVTSTWELRGVAVHTGTQSLVCMDGSEICVEGDWSGILDSESDSDDGGIDTVGDDVVANGLIVPALVSATISVLSPRSRFGILTETVETAVNEDWSVSVRVSSPGDVALESSLEICNGMWSTS